MTNDVAKEVEEAGWATANTLAEALPFIQIYDRETVVIKYGGHAMGEDEVAQKFAADAVLLKLLGLHPVVVHGGGPQISRMLERAGVQVDLRRRPARHRRSDHGSGRDGAVGRHQQGDRQLDQPGRAEADVRGVGLSGKDARLITVSRSPGPARPPQQGSNRSST
jgi:acetylglutamate kinase